jgi:hypothetical protein
MEFINLDLVRCLHFDCHRFEGFNSWYQISRSPLIVKVIFKCEIFTHNYYNTNWDSVIYVNIKYSKSGPNDTSNPLENKANS